jgi:lysyl-tRNA synthetase class 2
MASLEELRKNRISKLDNFRDRGVNPFPARSHRTHQIKEVLDNFDSLLKSKDELLLAGRIIGKRIHGGILFFDVFDGSGNIQFFVAQDKMSDKEDYVFFTENLDLGDFIEGKGILFVTTSSEKSLEIHELNILSKALRPIPEAWYGLEDKEERLRRRYLDLLVNEDVREIFIKKNRFWRFVRDYLTNAGFLEVGTPVLENIPGGAEAEPFVTHYNALDKDFYLRISLELALKRLIIGGYEKVFEIGRVFRNEGIDAEHLQDYTSMELYWAYSDYHVLMEFLEKMYKELISDLMGSLQTTYDNNKIDWSQNWPKVEYFDIFREKVGLDLSKATEKDLAKRAQELNIDVQKHWAKGKLIDNIFKKLCRPTIIQPSFLVNPPVEIEPLAKRLVDDSKKVERFQIVVGGTELGKGFSELNDPIDQRARFEQQMKLRAEGDKEAQMMDEEFIEALEYGMPPTGGFGLSERLFAFIMDKPIRETVIFPAMRPRE